MSKMRCHLRSEWGPSRMARDTLTVTTLVHHWNWTNVCREKKQFRKVRDFLFSFIFGRQDLAFRNPFQEGRNNKPDSVCKVKSWLSQMKSVRAGNCQTTRQRQKRLCFFSLFPSVIISSEVNLLSQNSRCKVEWVGSVLALTYLIIPNSPPLNSSFKVGGL